VLKRRIVGLALALGLLLSTIGPAFAAPATSADPGKMPPGLAKKVFIHYVNGTGPGVASLPAKGAGGGKTKSPCAPGTAGSADCALYSYSGKHWPAGTTVSYLINPTSSGLGSGVVSEAIQKSFDAWDVKTASLTYSFGGATNKAAGTYDGANVVSWGPLGNNILAVTTTWYIRSTIVETDMEFSTAYSWSYTAPTSSCNISTIGCNPGPGGPTGTYDVRNIGTHEAGHTLMLNDLYDTAASALTMYGYGSANELKKDSLGQGDINGVKAAYPAG
jgi:hypothetical protein